MRYFIVKDQLSRMCSINNPGNMKTIKYTTVVLALLSMVSCLKLQTNGAYNSNGDYWSAYTLNQWLKTERNHNCQIYAEAVKLAGMESLFDSIDPSTVIIPNDVAFAQLFSEMGISNINEFEPIVLKEVLSYLVMSQRFISTDMQEGVVIAGQNMVDKPIYLSKKSASGNRHQLYVNKHLPKGVENFAATTASVVMQDVALKDHVAQIVSNVPYFKVNTLKTDPYNGEPNTDQVIDMQTEADTYLSASKRESPFDLSIHCNSERIPIILYESIPDIDFKDEISVAKVNFYVTSVEGLAVNPFVLYDITDEAWELSEGGTDITKFYKAVSDIYTPTLSPENQIVTFDFDEVDKWTSIDITDYIIEHYKTPTPKPIAFAVAPANNYFSSVGILHIGYKVESNVSKSKKPSYIQIFGQMDSRIILQNNKSIECAESVVITHDNLLCTAPEVPDGLVYSPQNIIYRIIESPANGVLTRNCLPLKEGDIFTQNEINEGAIKYYNTKKAAEDSFKLKVADYTGATLPEPLIMNVKF